MKTFYYIISFVLIINLTGCRNRPDVNENTQNQVEASAADNTTVDTALTIIDSLSDTSKTINENIAARPNLKTLTSAIETAELILTLSGEGPFTVFAPTDSAFQMSSVKVRDLQTSGPDQKLQRILSRHIVSGSYRLSDFKDAMELTTIDGSKIQIRIERGHHFVNSSRIVNSNIIAKNGVIHTVDKVLLSD